MQFEMTIGTDYSTVRFTADIFSATKFKPDVLKSFCISFERVGGRLQKDYSWIFPLCITSEVLSEVIRNTCFVCGGLMQDGEALDNTYVYSDDFDNDAGQYGTTCSKIGQPIIKQVRKCNSCGHSHT